MKHQELLCRPVFTQNKSLSDILSTQRLSGRIIHMIPLILKEKEKENLCMKNAEKNVGRIHMKLKESLPLERQKETKIGARDQRGTSPYLSSSRSYVENGFLL